MEDGNEEPHMVDESTYKDGDAGLEAYQEEQRVTHTMGIAMTMHTRMDTRRTAIRHNQNACEEDSDEDTKAENKTPLKVVKTHSRGTVPSTLAKRTTRTRMQCEEDKCEDGPRRCRHHTRH